MANEQNDEKFGENQGSPEQRRQDETGKEKDRAGGQNDTTGQSETAGQEATGQTQPSGGADTLTGDRKAEGESGSTDPSGEGFVGTQGTDSGEYLQEKGKDDTGEGTSDKPPLDGE